MLGAVPALSAGTGGSFWSIGRGVTPSPSLQGAADLCSCEPFRLFLWFYGPDFEIRADGGVDNLGALFLLRAGCSSKCRRLAAAPRLRRRYVTPGSRLPFRCCSLGSVPWRCPVTTCLPAHSNLSVAVRYSNSNSLSICECLDLFE
jgi:hypothetical protein